MSINAMRTTDEFGVFQRINGLKKQRYSNEEIYRMFNNDHVPSPLGKPWTESSLGGFWSKYRQIVVDAAKDPSAINGDDGGEAESKINFLGRDNGNLRKIINSIKNTVSDAENPEVMVKLIQKVLEFA